MIAIAGGLENLAGLAMGPPMAKATPPAIVPVDLSTTASKAPPPLPVGRPMPRTMPPPPPAPGPHHPRPARSPLQPQATGTPAQGTPGPNTPAAGTPVPNTQSAPRGLASSSSQANAAELRAEELKRRLHASAWYKLRRAREIAGADLTPEEAGLEGDEAAAITVLPTAALEAHVENLEAARAAAAAQAQEVAQEAPVTAPTEAPATEATTAAAPTEAPTEAPTLPLREPEVLTAAPIEASTEAPTEAIAVDAAGDAIPPPVTPPTGGWFGGAGAFAGPAPWAGGADGAAADDDTWDRWDVQDHGHHWNVQNQDAMRGNTRRPIGKRGQGKRKGGWSQQGGKWAWQGRNKGRKRRPSHT